LASSLDARKVPEAQRAGIIADCNYEFRLYDDDGELYYEGVCKDLEQQSASDAFEPQDWAEYDSGCTRTDYRKIGETEWKTL
jgi:hypothetical protein